jgi:hypothetical protein
MVLPRSVCHHDDHRPTDALFFVARSIEKDVGAILDWHLAAINSGGAKD